MKLKKKFSGVILALALGNALVGCSSGQPTEGTPIEIVESESTMGDTVKGTQSEEEKEEVSLDEAEEEIQLEVQKEKENKEVVEKPVSKPGNTPETKPEIKPEVKPDNKPVTQPEELPEVKPEDIPAQKPEQQPEVTDLTAREVLGKITEGIEMPAHMDMDEFTFADTYGIDPAILESYQVKMPMLVVHASEIAVFQLKDVKDMGQVIDGINRRQQSVSSIWEAYLPEQFELVKNYKVVQKGNYILFVIEEVADTIISNFNNTAQ